MVVDSFAEAVGVAASGGEAAAHGRDPFPEVVGWVTRRM
jgi:hypothetical protein